MCEIELSHTGKNSGKSDLVCENCFWSYFCYIVLCAPNSFAIISLNKKEFVASLKLYSYFNVCIFICVLVSLPHGVMSCL